MSDQPSLKLQTNQAMQCSILETLETLEALGRARRPAAPQIMASCSKNIKASARNNMNNASFHLKHRAWYPWTWLLPLVVAIVGVVYIVHLWGKANPTVKEVTDVVFAVVAGFAAFIFFIHKQHLDETRLFMDLFKQFNERYDKLNNKLNDILDKPSEESLQLGERKDLFDYFNLCAEEYLYFRSGYLEPQVWTAWRKGMKVYAASPRIRALWVKELEGGSYYGFIIDLAESP